MMFSAPKVLLAAIGAVPYLAHPVQSPSGRNENACDNAHAELKVVLADLSPNFN